eukprot:g12940.t1
MPHEWFRDVCRIQYDDMDEISIDGQVVIRLCLLGLKFSAFGTLIACVLCPIYASTHGPEKGVLAWTMTNLSPDDDEYVFWFVVVAAYLLVFNFFWLIRAEWRHFVSLRQSHFLRRAVGKNGTSSAQAKRDTLLFYHLRALKKTSEAIVVCKCCQGCIHRYLEKTVQFERKVAQKYRQAGKYVQDFAMDGQVLELRDDLVTQLGIVVKPAPEADDVIWENVQLPFDQMQKLDAAKVFATTPLNFVAPSEMSQIVDAHLRQRRFVGRAVCVMGIIFWSFPITAIQALSQKNVLDQMLPHGWVAWLSENYPTVFSFITIYLPVVALLSLLVLLPWALHQIAVFVEARKSYAEVTISVMHRTSELLVPVLLSLALGFYKLIGAIDRANSGAPEMHGNYPWLRYSTSLCVLYIVCDHQDSNLFGTSKPLYEIGLATFEGLV